MLSTQGGPVSGQRGISRSLPRPFVPHSSRNLSAPKSAVCRAQAQIAEAARPPWTGDNWLSRFVNVLINTPPLYAAMKVLAKAAIRSSAQKKGVHWDDHVRRMSSEASVLEGIKAELENPRIKYPSYYLMPFHAYDEGNLSWLAAYEVEPATLAIALRTFPDDKLTPQEAFAKKRQPITDAVKAYSEQHGVGELRRIIDVGCSTGMSTRWLAHQFPQADVTGLDLSPYFLAVAEFEERRRMEAASPAAGTGAPLPRRIRYVHGLAEDTGLASGSVDLISFQFVIHECPGEVITTFIKESARVLRKGGLLLFVDNNPASKTIQNLPPPIYTLMKSTEPHSDSYYSYDLEGAMRAAGFKSVITIPTDHRHRAVLGIAP